MKIKIAAIALCACLSACQTSADEKTPAGAAPEPADLSAAERQARMELALAESRLELVLARQSLQRPDFEDAARRACKVLSLLENTPTEADVNGYALQAEGILARVSKAGVVLPELKKDVDKPGQTLEYDERSSAGRAWERYDSLVREMDEFGRIDAPSATYPDDWRAITTRRERYAGGETARSDPRYDADGRPWHVSIYDVRDLTYVPPDFQPPFSLWAPEGLRDGLDRHALRIGQGVFGGYYSWDMYTLMPMLRAFGGLDDFAWRGPKYSAQKQAQVVQMIEAFTDERPPTEPMIISLEP